jgi:hypothetical protein
MTVKWTLADEPELRKEVSKLIRSQFKSVIREEIDQLIRTYFAEKVKPEWIETKIQEYVKRELTWVHVSSSMSVTVKDTIERVVREKIEKELHLDFKDFAEKEIQRRISSHTFTATVRID